MEIKTVVDSERGCGYRKGGGFYLMGGQLSQPCGRMPFPLSICPCCNQGIKPTRGFTWLDTLPLVDASQQACDASHCVQCPLGGKAGRWGLIWIGGKFYARPSDFVKEAAIQGISRRLPNGHIPKGLEVGKTWILLAHREAIWPKPETGQAPEDVKPIAAIFSAFIPHEIQYVVKGDETEEYLQALVDRGVTPVKVERAGEQFAIPETGEEAEDD